MAEESIATDSPEVAMIYAAMRFTMLQMYQTEEQRAEAYANYYKAIQQAWQDARA